MSNRYELARVEIQFKGRQYTFYVDETHLVAMIEMPFFDAKRSVTTDLTVRDHIMERFNLKPTNHEQRLPGLS